MSELRCAWCPHKVVNPKPGKPAYKLAKGLGLEFHPICKSCYEKRRNNPLMEFKELETQT